MTVLNATGREVIRVKYKWKCICCCCKCLTLLSPCCGTILQVESPPGNLIGSVRGIRCLCCVEFARCCNRAFEVCDEIGAKVYLMRVPKKQEHQRGRDINFHLISNGKSVGRIGKKWDPDQVF